MKNLSKKYFLFLSEGPFVISGLFILGNFLLLLISCAIFGSEENDTLFLNKYWWICVVPPIVNMCLGYYIRGKYITSYDCENNYNGTLFTALVTKEGEKIIFTKPIWKTGKVYWVTSRDYSSLAMYEDGGKGETKTVCYVSGKYKNSLVKIPVTLTLKYTGPFDRLDLFDLLIKDIPNSKVLSLDDYLKKIFDKVNEKNQPKFDEIIGRYVKLVISETVFLNDLVDAIEFPERLFPYVADTRFCASKPEISACKGVMCGK